jgi:hypothetical protein
LLFTAAKPEVEVVESGELKFTIDGGVFPKTIL